MTAITISRQMGSLGCQVAEETARRLGYKLVWREIINQSAVRAGVPEVALATIDELDLLGLRPSRTDQQAYHRAVRHYLDELADEGKVVIVGRAGQVILKDRPGILHVRIIASKELRITRTASEKSIAEDKARMIVEKSDQSRARYLRRNYHAELDDPSLYDLVINTDRLLVPEAADVICFSIDKIQQTKKL